MQVFTGAQMLETFGGIARSMAALDEITSGTRYSNAAADVTEWLIDNDAPPAAVEAMARLAETIYEVEQKRWKPAGGTQEGR